MITAAKTNIVVQTTIHAPVERVWNMFTNPEHIVRWNHASSDWHSPKAENDLKVGGKFKIRMEARDGSDGFDFEGEYDSVILLKQIKYTMSDGRAVQVTFSTDGDNTIVTENFEAEATNAIDIQRNGWKAILENFKKYVEGNGTMTTLQFEILIDAAIEKVYNTMLDQEHYKEWTSIFNPNSRFEGTWQKDSDIRFIGEDEDGSLHGMISRIREHMPGQFVSIEHRGLIVNGKAVLCGPEAELWAGALENYTFTRKDDKTLVSVSLDTPDAYATFFSESWPKALEKLKQICEKH